MPEFSNHLISETSPYLLQHAHNPVEWYPWGEEALARAQQENKPILVSIGYSACHWCHVMERESFEDEETAAIMNNNFINIKIDREERPDLDHIYMEAVQILSGSGGWPLNVFLTPAKKPFYGGTYFPPVPAFNRPSWKQVLLSISKYYVEKQTDLENQAESLTSHLQQSNDFGMNEKIAGLEQATQLNTERINRAFEAVMKTADKRDGGFGGAPKFPQTFAIRFLFNHYYHTKSEDALAQALLSLDKMIAGGIYDHVGGGFARYSTDAKWLVPHFEKMLYDNALLLLALSDAYKITGNRIYESVIHQTANFINNEMTSPVGGLYAALDADSEGEEGKYYIWTKKEIENLLEADAALFCQYYNVTDDGNWEGRNIIHYTMPLAEFAAKFGLEERVLQAKFTACLEKLYQARTSRIRPATDHKIILGWNALMVSAFCKAYEATGQESYLSSAEQTAQFLLETFSGHPKFNFYHVVTDGKPQVPAFLDDYSYLVAALIDLQEITGNADYLIKAKQLTEYVLKNFGDEKGLFFYYTHKDQQDIIIRKKELYDGAQPSGNAQMMLNLYYLSVVFDEASWRERAINCCERLVETITGYPLSFGCWATLLQRIAYEDSEIVITGEKINEERKSLLRNFIPAHVLQSATRKNDEFPLLANKPVNRSPLFFFCKTYSCQNPVTEVHELIRLIKNDGNFNN